MYSVVAYQSNILRRIWDLVCSPSDQYTACETLNTSIPVKNNESIQCMLINYPTCILFSICLLLCFTDYNDKQGMQVL